MVNRMHGIWERVLLRPVNEDADFFMELGGDSLRAVELVDAVNDEFATDFDVSVLFDYPTVVAMAEFVGARHGRPN